MTNTFNSYTFNTYVIFVYLCVVFSLYLFSWSVRSKDLLVSTYCSRFAPLPVATNNYLSFLFYFSSASEFFFFCNQVHRRGFQACGRIADTRATIIHPVSLFSVVSHLIYFLLPLRSNIHFCCPTIFIISFDFPFVRSCHIHPFFFQYLSKLLFLSVPFYADTCVATTNSA